MADVSEIVAGAMEEATDGAIDASEVESSTPESTPEPSQPSGSEPVSPSSAAATPAEPPDELTQALEALGLKPTAEGQRENRIPQSRVAKMFLKAQKKAEKQLVDQHTAALKTEQDRRTQVEQQLQSQAELNRLAKSDPETYLNLMAAINPAFREYKKAQTPAAPTAASASVNDPMPPPDGRYADGSVGYTPEGLQKFMDWRERQTEARVKAELKQEYDKRFGPIEQEYKTFHAVESLKPVMQAKLATAYQTWGQTFLDNQQEILAAMQANDGKDGRPFLSFEAVTARVLAPKQQSALTTAEQAGRDKAFKELNARSAAASRSVPAHVAAASTNGGGPRSIEDIVAETIRAHSK